MGITIAYRGRLADSSRIEDFEDRLVDFALEIGAGVQIWRSRADDNPEREAGQDVMPGRLGDSDHRLVEICLGYPDHPLQKLRPIVR